MRFVVAILFATPFYVQFLIAAGLVYLGLQIDQSDQRSLDARAALIAQEPPAIVPLDKYSQDGFKDTLDEVMVLAQVATDHNTTLVRKTNGITTSEKLMFVLVAPDATAETKQALAVIVLDPDQKQPFVDWVLANVQGEGAIGPLVALNGLVADKVNSQVYSALEDQDMSRQKGLFAIEPFVAGRAETLSAMPAHKSSISWMIYLAAAAFALIGLFKMKKRRKAKGQGAAQAPDMSAPQAGSPFVTPPPQTATRALPAWAAVRRADEKPADTRVAANPPAFDPVEARIAEMMKTAAAASAPAPQQAAFSRKAAQKSALLRAKASAIPRFAVPKLALPGAAGQVVQVLGAPKIRKWLPFVFGLVFLIGGAGLKGLTGLLPGAAAPGMLTMDASAQAYAGAFKMMGLLALVLVLGAAAYVALQRRKGTPVPTNRPDPFDRIRAERERVAG